MMDDETEVQVARMAGLAKALTGQGPCQVKYTRSREGEVIEQGFYEPDAAGRWRAVSPPASEVN